MDRGCGGRPGYPPEPWGRHDRCDERRALRERMRLEGASQGLVGRGRRGFHTAGAHDDEAAGAATGPGRPSPQQLREATGPAPEPQEENLGFAFGLQRFLRFPLA